jgi:hypothetical protein
MLALCLVIGQEVELYAEGDLENNAAHGLDHHRMTITNRPTVVGMVFARSRA